MLRIYIEFKFAIHFKLKVSFMVLLVTICLLLLKYRGYIAFY